MRILSTCVWLRRGLVFTLCTLAVFCPSSLVCGQERQQQVLDPSLWDRYKIYLVGIAMLVLAQAALIVALLVQRGRRRRAEEQMRASQAQLRASYERIRDLGKRLLNAQEAERSVIARELHDDIGQQLAVLAIDLDVLNSAGSRRQDIAPLARDALERTQNIAKTLQSLSHELHPAKAQLIGLVAALESLRRDFSRAGLSVRLSHSNVPPSLPQDLTLCLFRIVQEALRNVVKHSGASEVAVQLSGSGQTLEVRIVDDGMGFDVDSAWTRGLGLISMSERLEPFRGTLYIRSKPGAGTQLEIRVPLPRPSATKTVA
jgi:signal transduction histidine kinase